MSSLTVLYTFALRKHFDFFNLDKTCTTETNLKKVAEVGSAVGIGHDSSRAFPSAIIGVGFKSRDLEIQDCQPIY